MEMELPREIYETYKAVAEKFAAMHASMSDDDRREANKRAIQTIRARHQGSGVLDGSRYVCKSQHNTGWAAASKDALAFVDPSLGPVEHGKRTQMFMFDMISGGTRHINNFPIVARNFTEEPRNPEAFVLVPDAWDWLGNGPSGTHTYVGGGHDTDTCDTCGASRFDAVHQTELSKRKHRYDGGEQDTGLCDICQKKSDDPIHEVTSGGETGLTELLRQILDSNLRQEQKLEEIRTALLR